MNSKILDIDYTVGEVELTYKSTSKSRNKIYSSEDAYKYLLPTYKEGTICYKEYFKVLFLNQSSQVLGYTLISEGGITDTTVDVRVILQAALLTNSVAQSTMKQQISGLGVEAQREIIHNHVKNKPILAEYIETESGKKSNRPQLLAALAMCRKTNSILIVAKLDRLSRNVAFTSKLLESDVEIVFCDFPQANRLILHIISSIAEYEAGLISQRTKQSLQAKKARGMQLGKSENLMNKFEQAVQHSIVTNKAKADNNSNNMRAIALLRSLSMQGKSLSEMTCLLNEQGFVTSKGCKFQITQVKRLLVRARLMS